MNKYLQLFRTGNAVMGIVGVTVASFMAAGTDMVDQWLNLLISAVVVFMFINTPSSILFIAHPALISSIFLAIAFERT